MFIVDMFLCMLWTRIVCCVCLGLGREGGVAGVGCS